MTLSSSIENGQYQLVNDQRMSHAPWLKFSQKVVNEASEDILMKLWSYESRVILIGKWRCHGEWHVIFLHSFAPMNLQKSPCDLINFAVQATCHHVISCHHPMSLWEIWSNPPGSKGLNILPIWRCPFRQMATSHHPWGFSLINHPLRGTLMAKNGNLQVWFHESLFIMKIIMKTIMKPT